MKKTAKNLIVAILGWQVRRLRKKADFKVVAVAGSVGKTSTKTAITQVLSQSFRVQSEEGNYNDVASVPLVFFGLRMPSLFNPLAWLATFAKIERQLMREYLYDVVVVEVGTDFPGNIAQFKPYLHADIGVLTAIAPEHMEYFEDMDAVAAEELTIAELADTLLINSDLCDPKYLHDLSSFLTYGTDSSADYRLHSTKNTDAGFVYKISKNNQPLVNGTHQTVTVTQLISITAAAAVADLLAVKAKQINNAVERVGPVSGRMQKLRGVNSSVILDDTYNASPEAARAALDALYDMKATQKIALLGNMNELGAYSKQAHIDIGKYCDPKQLDFVVTLGREANAFLAAEAERNGCKVLRSNTPHRAAEEIAKVLQKGAIILAKGSQNGVFAEEAVKKLLADPDDASLLVRQSEYWMKRKERSFKRT